MSEWTEQTIEDAIASVTETVDAIDPDGRGPYPFRKTFDRITEIRAAFKEVRFGVRDQQQALWSSLSAAGERLAAARKDYRENCKADHKRAATAIAELEYEFNSAAYGHSTWPDFWSKVRETRELLKGSRRRGKQGHPAALSFVRVTPGPVQDWSTSMMPRTSSPMMMNLRARNCTMAQ